MKGYYPCKKCSIFQINKLNNRKVTTFQCTAALRSYYIKSCTTCSAYNVVYLLQRPCHLQYVGWTTRPLLVHLHEHVGNIKRGYTGHSVSKQYSRVHVINLAGTLFFAIDKCIPQLRGSSIKREISKVKIKWIYNLRTFTPMG